MGVQRRKDRKATVEKVPVDLGLSKSLLYEEEKEETHVEGMTLQRHR